MTPKSTRTPFLLRDDHRALLELEEEWPELKKFGEQFKQ